MEDLIQTNYALDTFYFLVMGALVMFMAPGFAMLEAGLVRAKNTTEILTKNVSVHNIVFCRYVGFLPKTEPYEKHTQNRSSNTRKCYCIHRLYPVS